MPATRRTILVVEDDAVLREALADHLAHDHRVIAAGSRAQALAAFERQSVDLVVLDMHLPDGDGLSLIETFRADDHAPQVVVVTAFPKVQAAVRALKAGAFDFINKPFDLDQLEIVISKALEHRGLQIAVDVAARTSPKPGGVERMLGGSQVVERLRTEVLQVAGTPDTTVLVRGESGAGKELVAEAVHHESAAPRADGPLVRLDCSSIPETMMEAELFGHERGAFTDAKASRRGLLELADGGTLFLDEIGDLPAALQPKLLRVLETRRFRRVGGNREIEVDVRFVAATNRDLEAMVREGLFREDLLFRLKVFTVTLPPLRERSEDIAALAEHFLAELGRRIGRPKSGFTPAAMELFKSYAWPGNVRELRNVTERAVIVAQGDQINADDLPHDLRSSAPADADSCEVCPLVADGGASPTPLSEVERRYVACVYDRLDQNKTRTAEALGISRVTLRERLKRPAGGS